MYLIQELRSHEGNNIYYKVILPAKIITIIEIIGN